jgi:hypothetical protein
MKRWEAWINHAGWALVSATGIFYGVLKYFTHNPDPDSRLGHPWQPAVLAAHLLVAPAAVFALGLLFRRHALARWKRRDREGRRTGGILLLFASALVVSGYLLPVLTGAAARRWTGWVHAGIGLIVAAAYALHPKASQAAADETSVSP